MDFLFCFWCFGVVFGVVLCVFEGVFCRFGVFFCGFSARGGHRTAAIGLRLFSLVFGRFLSVF